MQALFNKKIYITIGIALVLLISIWIWKGIETDNIRSKAQSDYQGLKAQAIKGIATSKEEQLKLLAKPYVWAMRTELMKDNIVLEASKSYCSQLSRSLIKNYGKKQSLL